MRPGLDDVRDKQFGVFALWQVLCEYTRGEMRVHVDRGEWVRVFRGVYREAGTPCTARMRVEAARLSLGLPSVAAGYGTAAELHGFSGQEPATHVFGPRSSRTRRLVVHHDRIDRAELELVQGVLVTGIVRTVLDVARTAAPSVVLVTVQAALRQGVSRSALHVEAARHERRLGWGRAIELIERAAAQTCRRRIDMRAFRSRSPLAAELRIFDCDAVSRVPTMELPTRGGGN
ncbi:hypothetical protein ACFVMC_01555 [Nocardia sp. NPDC127579]|uniref:hypothetical protein n=1 Tax=Nocardia sp. NPDC127579 TaxID=3345402 RepID=UPI003628A4E0